MAFEQMNRQRNENLKFVDDGAGNPAIRTTATITGDVNVDLTALSTTGLAGKAAGTNADFTTAYAAATQITCSGLPSGVTSITADDIVSIQQVAVAGSVTNTYTRDDVTITAAGGDPTTLTVAGATFVATDTFIVQTSIARSTINDSVYAEDSAHTTGDVGNFILGVRNEAYAVFTGTDGDYSPISVTAGGKVHTQGEGFIAHDAADSGNPVKIGGYAVTTQRAAVADGDRVDLALTKNGEVILSTYDYSTQSNRSSEIDPVSGHHMSETLANVTDGADGTYYYYFDMDGYRYFTLQGAISSGSTGVGTETMTATVEISIQDDGTAPSSCTYIPATTELFGVASWTDTGGGSTTENFIAVLDEPVAVKYVRVKIVAMTNAADDGDWTIFMKKMF